MFSDQGLIDSAVRTAHQVPESCLCSRSPRRGQLQVTWTLCRSRIPQPKTKQRHLLYSDTHTVKLIQHCPGVSSKVSKRIYNQKKVHARPWEPNLDVELCMCADGTKCMTPHSWMRSALNLQVPAPESRLIRKLYRPQWHHAAPNRRDIGKHYLQYTEGSLKFAAGESAPCVLHIMPAHQHGPRHVANA